MEKKILLIEDNDEIRENTSEILKLSGYSVLTAQNGKVGVELAIKEKPDLIICDIMMPVLDGYGVLHLLSKNEFTTGIPFIFLTAKTERSDMRKGMEMGADDYITKPFDDIELLNAIESRLKKSESVRKEFSKNQEGLNDFLNSAKKFSALQQLSENRETRKYSKKETIYQEGAHAKAIFFVLKGKIKTHRSNELGKEFITGLYKDGDFFGYTTLFEGGKYDDAATALEETEISIIPKEDFFSLIYKNAEVSKQFLKIISNNLKEKEEQLVKLAYNSVRKRVAEALTTLMAKYKQENEKNFSITISREDLANIAGTATETTIRTLSDFKSEGLIDIKGSSVSIINPEKIARMKN